MKESLQEGQDNLDILIQLQDGTIRFAQGLEKAVSTFQGQFLFSLISYDVLVLFVELIIRVHSIL